MKANILIADREEPIALLLRNAVVRALDCDITLAHDPASAAEALRTSVFDLVLLDIGMHSDGLQTLEHVRGSNRFCEVIALTTGVVGARVLKTLAAADVFAVVAKPFDLIQLVDAVLDCLRPDREETPHRPLVYREPGSDPTLQ